tara:strand:+ start:65403 stop:66245 length:843 start_codon:yes stop_codon:yes gene_type:complete
MIYGSGKYQYKKCVGWGAERILGIATGVAVNSDNYVYVVDREPNPAVVVYDSNGLVLNEWGQDILIYPHEIWIDKEDQVYIPDCGTNTVRIFTKNGDLVQTLGTVNQVGNLGLPFNKPTRVVKGPSGDFYISDGYGQCYVHQITQSGNLIKSWGGRGSSPGMFTLPHNIFPTSDGRLLVADREPNNRIQVFDSEGELLSVWNGRAQPCGIFVDSENIVYLAEGGGVSILDMNGSLITQWVVTGGPDNIPHGPHGIWVDKEGNIYVGEVGVENLIHKFARI